MAVKKIWLIVISSISMIIILVIWVAYLSSTLPKIATGDDNNNSEESQQTNSFFTVFSRGLSVISGDINAKMLGFNDEAENFSKFIESGKNSIGEYLKNKPRPTSTETSAK